MCPIVITNSDAVVVDGHARLAAAQHLGVDEIPAVIVNHPDLRARQKEEC
jgi:ParB-like chromosome segregation protein Spo0J